MTPPLRTLLIVGITLVVGGLVFAWFLPLLLSLRDHEAKLGRVLSIGRWQIRARSLAGVATTIGIFFLILVTVFTFAHVYSRIAYTVLMFITGVGLFFWLLHRSQGEVPPEERRQWRWWNPLRRYWPLGMRAQLMIGYTVISSFILLIFTGIIFFSANDLVGGNLNTQIEQHANAIMKNISYDPKTGEPVMHDPSLLALDAATPTGASRASANIDYSTAPLVRVLDVNGKAVYVSPAFKNLAVSQSTVGAALNGSAPMESASTTDGANVTISLFSRPLLTNKQIYGVLQVGQSADTVLQVQSAIAQAEQVILPLMWLLAIGGSFALASRAFRPIRRLTLAAHNISMNTNDLSQRVPLPAARDDVRTMAQTFNEMLARLDRSFAQQRRFVADASHELRTPVAVIRSMTDVALAQEANSTTQDYAAVLRDVNAEAERLSKLINQLLTLARADDGQMRMDCDSVRLDLLADDVITSCAALAEERGITLRAAKLEPATVAGDTARLIQAIMSLVDNALTYTNPGGHVTLAVTTKGHDALLAVADTGIGIAPADLPHVCERFYRADPARSRAQGGSGLGLALVDGIVRVHGGTINVTSTLGQGSTFTLCLPLADAPGSRQGDAGS